MAHLSSSVLKSIKAGWSIIIPHAKMIILAVNPAIPNAGKHGSMAIGTMNKVYNSIWKALFMSLPPAEGNKWKPAFL